MAAASVFTAAGFIYCFKKQNAGRLSFSILLLTGVSLIAASALYAGLGRFSDWQDAKVETHIDPRLAAKITEARREVRGFRTVRIRKSNLEDCCFRADALAIRHRYLSRRLPNIRKELICTA